MTGRGSGCVLFAGRSKAAQYLNEEQSLSSRYFL